MIRLDEFGSSCVCQIFFIFMITLFYHYDVINQLVIF